MPRFASLLLVVLLALAVRPLAGCGGGTPVSGGAGVSRMAGVAVLGGPVRDGQVVAQALDGQFVVGRELARGLTDAEGRFDLRLPAYNGHVLLTVVGGNYVEPAVGSPVSLDGHALALPVLAYAANTSREGLLISPPSTLALALARAHVRAGQESGAAWAEATSHVYAHLGAVDWATVAPADLAVPGVTSVTPAAAGGAVLAGLSSQALALAEASSLTPATVVHLASLLDALVLDASDATLDGLSPTGPVFQASTRLDGATLRRTLAQGVDRFLLSPRAATTLRPADVRALTSALARASDPYLFCPGQLASPSCAPAGDDVDGPSVTWLAPAEGAGVSGVVPVRFSVRDASSIASVVATAPLVIADGGLQPLDGGCPSGVRCALEVAASVDVSARADGPLALEVTTTDEWGNRTVAARTVAVAQRGPRLTVQAPSDGATVRGTSIAVTAQAVAAGGAVASLALIDAPAGMGADLLPAADVLSVTWDTTRAPEGSTVLHFRAVDVAGAATDMSVTVTVDNLEPGRIDVRIFAGAPVADASAEVWGWTTTDGGADAGLLLGSASGSDDGGTLSVPLAREGYAGPVQVVVTPGAATYVDPSDQATRVAFPATQRLTSTLPAFTSGQTVVVPVTLWTTLGDAAAAGFAAGRNPSYPGQRSVSSAQAITDALLAQHMGPGWSLRTTVPAALGQPQALRDVVFAASADVALNVLARELSVEAGVSPGRVITAPTLIALLSADVQSDGLLDGRETGIPLLTAGSPAYRLDANTTRFRLARALDAWVASPANSTGISRADLAGAAILDRIAGDTSALYPVDQRPITDTTAPTLTWETPSAGAGVSGVVTLRVRARDLHQVATLTLAAPAQAAGPIARADTGCAVGSTGCDAVLAGALDVTALPDGPVTVSATAVDEYGNSTTSSLQLVVAQQGPRISISTPTDSATVRGTVQVRADASPATAGVTVTSLVLVDPPSGVGADTLPAAAALAASWDTTRAAEGPAALHFRAVDSAGATTDLTITVTVDNLEPGRIDVRAFAGNPVSGATAEVWGWAADGGADGGPVLLGSAGATDDGGTLAVPLARENFIGRVRVVLHTTGATVLDPSDQATTVAFPAGFDLSTTLPFTSGQTVVAPVTLWTTLADAALEAVAKGRNVRLPAANAVAAQAAVDPLMRDHLSAGWALRQAVPVSLAVPPPQTLGAAAFAALVDTGLSELARELSIAGGVTPGRVITGPSLAALLVQDIEDGQFDGKASGVALRTEGAPAYALDANTLRFRLARAIDLFLRTPQNASGLRRSDLQTAGVLDRISGDVSALYDLAPPPIPFDADPPTVFVTATYSLTDGGAAQPPLDAGADGGAPPVVAGIVTVTVEAADPSGMGSTSATVAGVPLQAVPGAGSGPARFVGTWETRGAADGLLTVDVLAVDRLGNSGTTQFVVTTDNTPPTWSPVLQPVAGTAYSQVVPVDVSATDAHGLAAITYASGDFTGGVTDNDPTPGRFAGSWSIPAGTADGPKSAVLRACDPLGNCSTTTIASRTDRTGPTVTLVNVPDDYVNATSIDVSARAMDSAGVASVVARNGTGPATNGVFNGSIVSPLWRMTGIRTVVGANRITITASDKAVPANVTTRAIDVFVDQNAPSVTVVNRASFFDELAIQFRESSSGVPVVPAEYAGLPSTRIAVVDGSAVNRAFSRASAPGVTAAELEGANPRNVPFIQVQAPQQVGDGPIGSATWTATCASSALCGDAAPPVSGSLLESTSTTPATVVYDLPLTVETLGAAMLNTGRTRLRLTLTDRAGNTGSTEITVFLNVVGVPLSIMEDTSWDAASDPTASAAYRIGSQGYQDLFGSSGLQLYENAPRLVRYIVRNPLSQSMVTQLSLGLSQVDRIEERWDLQSYPVPQGGSFTNNGYVYPWFQSWAGELGSTSCASREFPCGAATTDRASALVMPGTAASRVECPGGIYPLTQQGTAQPALSLPQNSYLTVQGLQGPASGGQERNAATQEGSGWVVPAASSSTPGSIVLYVARPLGASRSNAAPALAWVDLNPAGPTAFGASYQRHVTWIYVKGGANGCNGRSFEFRAHRGVERIGASSEIVQFQPALSSRTAAGAMVSGDTGGIALSDVNKTIAH